MYSGNQEKMRLCSWGKLAIENISIYPWKQQRKLPPSNDHHTSHHSVAEAYANKNIRHISLDPNFWNRTTSMNLPLVFLAHMLWYRVAHYHEVLYKYKTTLCNQQATILEANEDNKVQVLCAHFYQTVVSSELHGF